MCDVFHFYIDRRPLSHILWIKPLVGNRPPGNWCPALWSKPAALFLFRKKTLIFPVASCLIASVNNFVIAFFREYTLVTALLSILTLFSTPNPSKYTGVMTDLNHFQQRNHARSALRLRCKHGDRRFQFLRELF